MEQQTNEHGWEFLYMGADQDAVEVGRDLGVKDGQAITHARGKSREAMLTVSGNIRDYRSAKLVNPGAAMPEFTTAQRAQVAPDAEEASEGDVRGTPSATR